jgi:hypothetical protein
MLNKLRKLFFGETYQEVLDRKYGGSIPTNLLVNDRELNNAGKKKKFKIEISETRNIKCNKLFYAHSLNKHHFRKGKITKIFSL